MYLALSILVFFFLFTQKPVSSQFLNSPQIIADGGTTFDLTCNINDVTNINLQWIRSLNKALNSSFLVEPTSRIIISDNGKKLTFLNIGVLDEEYYACVYFNSTTSRIRIVSRYNLFVRVVPTLSILLNGTNIDEQTTIQMLNSKSDKVYRIICSSSLSKPDVDLSIYDTDTLTSLANGENSILSKECTQNLCTNTLQVDFSFKNDNRFNKMKSINCTAKGNNSIIDINVSVKRNTNVSFSSVLIQDAINLDAFIGNNYTIECNTTEKQIQWVQTFKKEGFFQVNNNSRLFVSSDGKKLNFNPLVLSDEEYYGCGIFQNGNFQIVNSYYLYTKVLPTLNIVFNYNTLITESDTIYLKNSYLDTTYPISCLSLNSKPDIVLSIYESESLISLTENQETFTDKRCNETLNLCNNELTVQFRFKNDSRYRNLKSLSCKAESLDKTIILTRTINRAINITNEIEREVTSSTSTTSTSTSTLPETTTTSTTSTSTTSTSTSTLPETTTTSTTSTSTTSTSTSTLPETKTTSTTSTSTTTTTTSTTSTSTTSTSTSTLPETTTTSTTSTSTSTLPETTTSSTTSKSTTTTSTTSTSTSTLPETTTTSTTSTSTTSTSTSTLSETTTSSTTSTSTSTLPETTTSSTTSTLTTTTTTSTTSTSTTSTSTSTLPETTTSSTTSTSTTTTSTTSTSTSTLPETTTSSTTSTSTTTTSTTSTSTSTLPETTTSSTTSTSTTTTSTTSTSTSTLPETTTTSTTSTSTTSTSTSTLPETTTTSTTSTSTTSTSTSTLPETTTTSTTSTSTSTLPETTTTSTTSTSTSTLPETTTSSTTSTSTTTTSTTSTSTSTLPETTTTSTTSTSTTTTTSTTSTSTSTLPETTTSSTTSTSTTTTTTSTTSTSTTSTSTSTLPETTTSSTTSTSTTTTTTSTTSTSTSTLPETTTTTPALPVTTTTSTTSITPFIDPNLPPLIVSSQFLTAFQDSDFTLSCSFDNPLYWTYGSSLITSSSKYFNGISGNLLTIYKIKREDSGNYSCYSILNNQLVQSLFTVYVKTNPVLTMSVNNRILKKGDVISFGLSSELTITCTAINSRPLVNIKVYDPVSEATLPAVIPLRNNTRNPLQFCDPLDVCQTVLQVTLTPGFATKFSIKNITCLATNRTSPYELASSLTYALDFNNDACLNNQCKNGSSCRKLVTAPLGYVCDCLSGLGGPFCNFRDTCADDTTFCGNFGICRINSNGMKFCSCLGGYSGLTCRFQTSLCTTSNICNGGTCRPISTTVDGYFCTCNPGFTGKNCEAKFNPCLNGGSVTFNSALTSGYTCSCSIEFRGSNCQFRNPCANQPCKNGGTCLAIEETNNDSFLCECPKDFVGDLCERSKFESTCVDKNPSLCPRLSSLCEYGYFNGKLVKELCPKTCGICS